MDKHLCTETFGDNNIATVCMIDNIKAGTSDTTTVSIEANAQKFTLEVSHIPCDHELQDMAAWVKTSIDTSLKGAMDNELVRISERIHLYLQQAITFRAMVAITSHEVVTGMEWIKISFNGKKRASDGRYHGWMEAWLMTGSKEVEKLNAKQLYQRLDNHPGTPIYHTGDLERFEIDLLPEDRIELNDKAALYRTLRMHTTAQRVKSKIAATKDGKLLFTKKGIQDPKPTKPTAHRTNYSNNPFMTF